MSDKYQKLVEEIEKLSVLELSELVKVLEEKFGVSAQAAMVAAAPAQVQADGASEEEKNDFTVVLADGGGQKIQVIKAIRELTGKSLKEAKDMVDGAPQNVAQGVKKEQADEMKAKLEEAGAKVELK
ncbi:MAG: 50S ribosomal protein L7/L12 [Candidatus Terrybacteria bacterium RIFCSPLOWO2_01_FULL_44_24]|uniref:Large ribosomal subunit protein bL12 n=1 Tax=Candidatus Terrybacteria bacterium RIFCSPHIGHO2_01_FULL_43_35 TaxID=1802361 RepID=A0A1G2PFZ0_9BACT|nr:MAG: 50S ribosomal protein L7/L12 [Candidatus Terrybacteria bacterium RIFCSPHIGHO2_01_FULL_43_35]OHA49307.1 MAG: 50S ribosomal protein L7/L12 [Candidatus Terrybacteria bacterium RIFCSPHIGHO2_02_FULL_43_14]OHA52005.1 MAG: 50S ribosomal protein L7/L12 [Candidatus Terrybacteria bacterium RIFCSPLOWO2_01_FULL_44_24]